MLPSLCVRSQVHNNLLPLYFIAMCISNCSVHDHNTRQCDDFHVPYHRIALTWAHSFQILVSRSNVNWTVFSLNTWHVSNTFLVLHLLVCAHLITVSNGGPLLCKPWPLRDSCNVCFTFINVVSITGFNLFIYNSLIYLVLTYLFT